MKRLSLPGPGWLPWAAGVVLIHVTAAPACGGKAVVDSPAAGGGGSSSTSSGTGGTTSSTSTSTSTSTTSSGTGGGPGSLCMEACAKIDGCLNPGTDCVGSCQGAMDGCISVQDDYLMCVIDAAMGSACGPVPDCADALESFNDCKGIHEVGGGCSVDPGGGCSCDIEDDQNNLYEAQCSSSQGDSKCECFFNTVPVGQCSYTGEPDCDPFSNCCASLIFVPALPG